VNDIIVFQLQCLSIVLGTKKWSHCLLNKFFLVTIFFGISFKHLSECWSYGYLQCTHTSPCTIPPSSPPLPPPFLTRTYNSAEWFLTRSLPAWRLHAIQYWLILWFVDILWRFYQRRRNWGSYPALVYDNFFSLAEMLLPFPQRNKTQEKWNSEILHHSVALVDY